MDEKLRFDYEQTHRYFLHLADILFKLRALVPAASGAAVALFTGTSKPETSLAIGLLGLIVTLGITAYDLRITQYYDAAIHRARALEADLKLPLYTKGPSAGGLFNERPPRGSPKLFGRITLWHDRGLALVYGAAVGGWAYIIVDSLLSLLGLRSWLISILLSVVVGAAFFWEFQRRTDSAKPQPLDAGGTAKPPSQEPGPVLAKEPPTTVPTIQPSSSTPVPQSEDETDATASKTPRPRKTGAKKTP